MTGLVSVIIFSLWWGYLLFMEYIDWHGRAEIIEKRNPRLWLAMNNRPARLVMLIAIAALLGADVKEKIVEEPPTARFGAPSIPMQVPGSDPVKDATITAQLGTIAGLRKDHEQDQKSLDALKTKLAGYEADHCWIGGGHRETPEESMQAKILTEFTIFCNHKLSVPWHVQLQFDADHRNGSVWVEGNRGSQQGGADGGKGTIFSTGIAYPAVPAYTPIITRVYSDIELHVVKGNVAQD